MPNQSFVLFNAAALTTTSEISRRHLQDAAQIAVQLRNFGFSGTLDFQGKAHSDAAQWVALPYYLVDAAGPLALDVAQLTYTTETANHLIILPVVLPLMQVVMTRSAGNISLYGWATKSPSILQFAGA